MRIPHILLLCAAFTTLLLIQQRAFLAKPHTHIAPATQQPGTDNEQLGRTRTKDDKTRLQETLQATSLAQTSPPARLSTDSQGRLIHNPACIAVLDYFLLLSNELSQADIIALIGQWARVDAGKMASHDLLALLEPYQRYRQKLASGAYAASSADDIEHQLLRRQQKRNELFGTQVAAVLFADQEHYDRFRLQRLQLLNSSLNDSEKQTSLNMLLQTLPEHLREQYQRQQYLQEMAEQRASPHPSPDITPEQFAIHQQQFGNAAAMRLQQQKQQRQQWQHRYQAYAQQRNHLLGAGLTDADRRLSLEALRAEHFDGPERLRAAALDRLQQP